MKTATATSKWFPHAIKRVKKLPSKEEKVIEDLFKRVPNASIDEVIDALVEDDPVTWTMVARRLRGHPMVFDIAEALEKAEEEYAKVNWVLDAREKKNYKSMLLRHRPFLLQPLSDVHPHKVYMKGRQVGVSELSITEVLWFLDTHPGVKWVYTFPRDKQLNDFSNTRIKEALEETPRMRRLLTGTDQVTAKGIGRSHLLLRSAWEENLGEGIDADGVTLDERDRMKANVDVAFRESLSSSKHGFFREVSTPTLPNFGVDVSFTNSDQFHWFVRCTKCGLKQIIEYPENIMQVKKIPLGVKELEDGTYDYRCRVVKCRGKLDRYRGEWVAKYPDRKKIRGYHIPQTIAPWISATEVMQKKIDYKILQLWENYVLGKTSKGEFSLTTEQDFTANSANYNPVSVRTKDWSHISIGIDWGNTNWVVVLGKNAVNGKNYLLGIIIIDDDPKNELACVNGLIPRFAALDPDIIIADFGYGKDRNARLNRIFQHKFYACLYNPNAKSSRTFNPQWSDNQDKVLVDRTMTLKVVCNAIKERQFGFPSEANEPYMILLKKHFSNLAPVKIEEDGEIWEEIQATGDDHLCHAFAYAFLGLDKLTAGQSFNFSFV